MDEDFKLDEFEQRRGGRFGTPLRYVPLTGSTNADALAWAAEGAEEGAVVVAGAQSAGRGRWDRSWLDRPGGSLLFSLVLRPLFEADLVTTALGVAVCEAVEATTGATARIKWPNDVTVAGLKVAGILVEARVRGGDAPALVAGIGINVGWTEVPDELTGRASSLLLTTGTAPPRESLLAAVLRSFEARYDALAAGDSGVLVDATARSETLGREVLVVRLDGAELSGRALRLAPTGALVVETASDEVVIRSGDVTSLRPASGDAGGAD